MSGGYYVAAAADAIYASRSSIVGSIGVLMDGFGFADAMRELGIARRLITAGEHKGFLDPFSPASQEEIAHLQSMLEEVHDEFIDVVKRGRGDRLADDADIFSGLMWTGVKGKELGLVDAFGSSRYVAREVIGVEDIVDFTVRPSHLDTIADRLGGSIARTLGAALNLEVGHQDRRLPAPDCTRSRLPLPSSSRPWGPNFGATAARAARRGRSRSDRR